MHSSPLSRLPPRAWDCGGRQGQRGVRTSQPAQAVVQLDKQTVKTFTLSFWRFMATAVPGTEGQTLLSRTEGPGCSLSQGTFLTLPSPCDRQDKHLKSNGTPWHRVGAWHPCLRETAFHGNLIVGMPMLCMASDNPGIPHPRGFG